MSRRIVFAFAALLAVGVALILVGVATDDEDDPATGDTSPTSVAGHGSQDAADCGIEVPEIAGTETAPVCALGFGIAVPRGWNATRLDDPSLQRLSNAELSRPSFLPAARTAAASGAAFYAAGVDEDGSVSDLKVDVAEGADTGAGAIEAAARAVVDGSEADEARLVDATAEGARVDFRGIQASAETGEDIEYHATHLFIPDGDRLWSVIVTAEDEEQRDELVEIFTSSLTFD